MTISLNQRLKLRRLIKKLNSFRGKHTGFVSVYVPPEYDLTKIINSLQDEQGTATNIKDKNNSKSVITSLEKMIRTLKSIEKTPKNGLAIFSGNVSDKENVQDYQVFWIEPPEPLNLKTYKCDNKFLTQPLEEMDANEVTYALVVIDKSEATVGLLIGSTIKVLRNMQSTVPGKFKTGGQSAQRFERIRAGAAIEFYKRVADYMIEEFTYMNDLKGIIIGGPGTTKQNFVDGSYLNEQLKQKVLAVKDITYTTQSGLYELLEKSYDVLSEDEVMTEKKELEEFFKTLATESNMVSYGFENTKKALEMSAVGKLILIDEELTEEQLQELTNLAENTNAEIILVTDKTSQGSQFKGLTGIGAILRYPIEM